MATKTMRRATKGRILIADDEPCVREVMSRALEAAGYETVVASDGVEVFDRALAREADAALLDLNMPRADGIAGIRALKRLDPTLSVIAMTGSASREKVAESLAAGARSCLLKPFPLDVLLDLVGPAVEGTRRLRGERPAATPTPAPRPSRGGRRIQAAVAAAVLGVSLLAIEGLRIVRDQIGTRIQAVDGFLTRVEGYLARDEGREVARESGARR
ncbi:MAG: response regulator [Planctomycetales bacterium]|nr:response regulator [Planctomycetales bacterium]